ncbi:hypothetical protein FY152_04170 [Agrobacterium tumefaciens]|nr:hypothetical protein FY152_04170 [Agrobacterium tumefaciens]
MDQNSILEVAQQLNAMDLPFGSAFIVAALAIYIFKQYLELKKQHLEIRAKLMEMSTTTSGAAIAGPPPQPTPLAEISRDKRAGTYIAGFGIGVLATLFRYFLSEAFDFLASMGDTFQVLLWGSHGRQFGVWAYPTMALLATKIVFSDHITKRDFFIAVVLFTTILPVFLSTIAVLVDSIF